VSEHRERTAFLAQLFAVSGAQGAPEPEKDGCGEYYYAP